MGLRVTVATAVAALVWATAAAPGGAVAADGEAARLVVPPGPVDLGDALPVTGEGFVLPEPDTCELRWEGPASDEGARCAVKGGVHAWLTVGPVSAEKETTYGVRVCAPSCASPWAGIAIGTITVVPTGTPSDDVGAPGSESPDVESGMTAGRELAYVGLAVLTGVIAHHAEVSPGRAEAGQRVDVTTRAIPHDTTRLTDCQLLWDGTPGGSC
ncbi:MAG: hypothetical protein M3Q27_14570 [Actinomycetota bacterium]|nr:hypothetical protein [Actinomycetota bacterium]